MSIGAAEREILRRHARAVVHMRERSASGAFGLILGAGVSRAVGFPSWSELVCRIAEDPEVEGKHLLQSGSTSDTAKTQMLFQHYRSKKLETVSEPVTSRMLRRIHGEWRRVIQRCLYVGTPTESDQLRSAHPYLAEFVPLAMKSPMTVTYNFDDTLERLVRLAYPDRDGQFGRSFETVWNAALQFRPGTAVIYHPNGFLPNNLLEGPSDTIVFSEDTFADQLIESMAGHHASLLHHLSKTTCLFLGLSLNDTTLRHLLRQNAKINPGHFHYYVSYVGEGETRNPTAEQALRDANFEVYNLITLFLTNAEIASLGRLLTADENDLRHAAEEEGAELRYVFYLSGAIGAGKTTSLGYLGSLQKFEEWTEPRIELLAKAWTELEESERREADAWILGQFVKKNMALLDCSQVIAIVDRPPLDPLSFTKETDISAKAQVMRAEFGPGQSGRRVCPGRVILLTGQASEMEARVIGRHKQSSAQVIDDLQKNLLRIYPTVTQVDTSSRSVHDVVGQVARIIHLDTYEACDLAARLDDIATNGLG